MCLTKARAKFTNLKRREIPQREEKSRKRHEYRHIHTQKISHRCTATPGADDFKQYRSRRVYRSPFLREHGWQRGMC